MSEGEDQFLEDIGLAGMPKDTIIGQTMLVSTVALNMAMRWHDMGMIKDGSLYQQKKLEGANIRLIDLPDVLATAQMFEAHLLAGPNRHAKLLADGITDQFVTIVGGLAVDAITKVLDGPDKPRPRRRRRGDPE